MKKLYIIGLMACSIAACKPKIDQEPPTAGTADFSRYLSIGNSATAGFADGTLYREGQETSYPAILAEQFELVGGGNFVQPLLPSTVKGYPEARMVLQVVKGACDTVLRTVPEIRGKDSAESSINIASEIPFNNMGIPNVLVADYIRTGYANSNLYAKRSFRDVNATPLKEAMRVRPSFFSIWLGNNDVLLNGIFGGSSSPIPISDENTFRTAYDSIVVAVSRNAKGVVLNIPHINLLPYFTTIKPRGLMLTEDQATSLNVYYREVVDLPIRFEAGANHYIIQDGNEVRKIRDNEMLLLSIPYDSLACAQWGTVKPIPEHFVLNTGEIAQIKAATDRFNSIISDIANAHKVPVVDVNAFLGTIQEGVKFNGLAYSDRFIGGDFYSLDGVHLTPRGNALLANHILRTINSNYNSSIPEVDANKFRGVRLP